MFLLTTMLSFPDLWSISRNIIRQVMQNQRKIFDNGMDMAPEVDVVFRCNMICERGSCLVTDGKTGGFFVSFVRNKCYYKIDNVVTSWCGYQKFRVTNFCHFGVLMFAVSKNS
uniref:Apple domain-containing protein n=1 Tax=Panagrellus redivivus TaxID=6233 RepID=A0A7E4VQG7_PANRE